MKTRSEYLDKKCTHAEYYGQSASEPGSASIPELPVNFDDCTDDQLRWLSKNGTYGQRLIADSHLASITAQRRGWL